MKFPRTIGTVGPLRIELRKGKRGLDAMVVADKKHGLRPQPIYRGIPPEKTDREVRQMLMVHNREKFDRAGGVQWVDA